MLLATLVLGLAQGVALIAVAPALVGLLRWLEARLQRRQGPPVLQPYRDLAKLLARPAVRPAKASRVFALTPYVLFAAYGTLAFMLPVFSQHTLLRGDLILILYLLGLARFMLSLAGLDVGAGFGGLGASREMFLHFLTEIGLALLVVALAIRWGTTDLAIVFSKHWGLGPLTLFAEPELVLLGMAMFLMILFEAERIPIDNPATHLELTMSQRAITLEFAGRDLALVEWAEAIKLAALLTIAGQLFVPLPYFLNPSNGGVTTPPVAVIGYALRIGALILVIAISEACQPKRRLRSVPRLALTAIVLSAMTILYALLVNQGSAIP